MESIKDIGEIEVDSQKYVSWIIPNFYSLPQIYDTVIRSPRFKINDRDWYMEVYPNGRKLYSSLGWFGISALNLNSESSVRNVCFGVTHSSNGILSKEESHGDGLYCCSRLIPSPLFNSWKDILAPEGDLSLYLNISDDEDALVDNIRIILSTDDVQELFQSNFENICAEACVQAEKKDELTVETAVGDITFFPSSVEWKIPKFSDILHRYDTVIRSPRFHKKDSDWYMEVYPNGQSFNSSLGWFGIAVYNLNSDTTLRCTSVIVFDKNYEISVDFKADSQNKGFSCSKLLPSSLLKSWQDVIAPGGNFHLTFPFTDEDDDTQNKIFMKISKESMQRWYKQKYENADTFIEASTQTEEEIVQRWYKQKIEKADTFIETSSQTEEEIGLEKMRQDFQEILLKESISDIVLKVKSQEYKAHRFILAARSPVFLAMMTHDTNEKNTGVVNIPDGDPKVFPDFLKYLYTGSISNLTSENAVNLYTMADKYQVSDLKESCKNVMMTNISIDNFCDVFTLSLQHDERELKDACIQYFAKNSFDIIVTCKWQAFLSENPIVGNELFIKHFQLNK